MSRKKKFKYYYGLTYPYELSNILKLPPLSDQYDDGDSGDGGGVSELVIVLKKAKKKEEPLLKLIKKISLSKIRKIIRKLISLLLYDLYKRRNLWK